MRLWCGAPSLARLRLPARRPGPALPPAGAWLVALHPARAASDPPAHPPQVQFTSAGVGGAEAGGEGEAMVRGLQGTRLAVDEKLEKSRIQVGRRVGGQLSEK